jgi:hypothetical protein
MRIKMFFSFLMFAQIVFGQTEKLVKVLGTKCSLVPPSGFIAATNFSGFQNEALGASIMINELPAPYQTLVDGLTEASLKARGMTLVNKQVIDYNGAKGTFINVTQSANGTTYIKQMLVFGDTNNTVLVNGIYPKAAAAIEAEIKEALLSTVYNSAQNDNPLDAVTFMLDVKDSDFKLVKYIFGSLLYSTDGKIPTKKPTIIIGNSISKAPSNRKQYAIQRLKKLPGAEKSVIKEIKDVVIDNLKGYEIIANGMAEGKPELLYQVMLFNDQSDYYIFVGQSREDFKQYLASFRKIVRTFKRK